VAAVLRSSPLERRVVPTSSIDAVRRWTMYTAIRTYTTSDPGEVRRLVQQEFVPMVKDLPGFIGYYLVDAGDGKIASITVCDEREDVEESTKRAADWVRDRLSSLITSGPEVMIGDTVVSETAARVAR
jgi:hypothetical protein